MTEHVHEWNAMVGDGIFGQCADKDCHKVLDWDEIDRRLNATEQLSAEDAGKLKDMHYPVAYEDDEMCFKLYDYIATLKGFPLHPHTRNASALKEKTPTP